MSSENLLKEDEAMAMEPVNQLSGISRSVGQRHQSTQQVRIEMCINSYIMLFGMPFLLTVMILGSVGLGAYCLNRTVVIPNLTVNPPHIEAKLNVPPPIVNVKPSDVPITINVPPLELREMPGPNVSVTIPEGKRGEVQIIEKVIEKRVEIPVDRIVEKRVEVPIYVETAEQGAVTIHDIFPLCEKYVEDYFTKTGRDPKTEQKKWLDGWSAKVAEIGDEQRVANDTMLNKRGALKIDTAKIEEIIEICRIMLRYRDAKLAIPTIFKDSMTADNLWKFRNFLVKGPIVVATIK